ncbi:MAG: restriction endonuclease subunit S [Muribaculaceae bacterium]|nr:restriction endonuclease subunit S [Muribaculaceae bacterium]
MIYKTFQSIRFKDITNWSVLQQKQHDFGYTDIYPLVAIGKFLIPNKTKIEIKNDVEYKQLTVKIRGGGVSLRCLKYGRDIGTKQQWLAHRGQFILSKIDARNGAMGIISEELDGAIVTHDFPLFDVNTQIINPHFLLLIITTKLFMNFAQSCSSGTTNRRRINIQKFLQQQIPLPSLEEQNRLIDIYNRKLAVVKYNDIQYRNTLISINCYLKTKLGLSISKIEDKQGFRTINYKDITRWDYQFYKNKKQISSEYQLVEIGTLLYNFMKGPNNNSIRCNTDIKH